MNRPSGANISLAAWWAGAAGIAFVVVALCIKTVGWDGVVDETAVQWRITAFIFAAFCFQVAFVLAVVAVIIRAIWFLPARDDLPATHHPRSHDAEDADESTSKDRQAYLVGLGIVIAAAAIWLVGMNGSTQSSTATPITAQ